MITFSLLSFCFLPPLFTSVIDMYQQDCIEYYSKSWLAKSIIRTLYHLPVSFLTNGVVALLHIILLSLQNSDGECWLNFKRTVGNFKRFLYVEDYRWSKISLIVRKGVFISKIGKISSICFAYLVWIVQICCFLHVFLGRAKRHRNLFQGIVGNCCHFFAILWILIK